MTSLDQAIAQYEQFANVCEHHGLTASQEEFEQLVEWLRELRERRKQQKIVQCKDCKWWKKQKDSAQGRCRLLGIYPTGAWYCGNAERRTE